MHFAEAKEQLQDIPPWAGFLLRFGYLWPPRESTGRRIALVSMPCDSAAAGLIALGMMLKYLEDPDANDTNLHLQRIRKEQDAILIYRHRPKWKFRYCGQDNGHDKIIQIKKERKDTSSGPVCMILRPEDICFQGEPFPQVINSHALPHATIYRKLMNQNSAILESNLRTTFSGVCLAGRSMGENKTREIMSDIRFKSDSVTVGLDQLLSVHEWHNEKISRLSFFNSRTKKRDRATASPLLVVADGDGAFLEVLDHKIFSQSDVIATIDRTMERERLEKIRDKITSMSQWYLPDEILPDALPSRPHGISISSWKKR